jgi:hypothetical protein
MCAGLRRLHLSVLHLPLRRACGVDALQYGFLPPDLRGRYFATDQSVSSHAGITGARVNCGRLALLPPDRGFVIAMAVALAGGVMSLISLRYWPEAKPEPTSCGDSRARCPGSACVPRRSGIPAAGHPVVAACQRTGAPERLLPEDRGGLGQSHIILFAVLRYSGIAAGGAAGAAVDRGVGGAAILRPVVPALRRGRRLLAAARARHAPPPPVRGCVVLRDGDGLGRLLLAQT